MVRWASAWSVGRREDEKTQWRDGERLGAAADRDAGRCDRITVLTPCLACSSRPGTRIRRGVRGSASACGATPRDERRTTKGER
ncbi:hypothetical protein EZV77_20780 [Burkholderia thailandensis]|nr:hypothetical protein [Burkholderia thailandensis]MDD1487780.1 hypothetical protein [Burkholderia thailandensis]MDD1493703.1 hypothetical protein [Burkholderia thailandensis]TBW59875.1 hypothetical protein EZV77_20780 [Burkholderia thailandensis]TGB29329.1 hypothetical protein C6946_30160 [Burkholderia thailandensis]